MRKTATFGPGHPDFDNQLDLFSLAEPSNDDGAPPVEKSEVVPCPRCADSGVGFGTSTLVPEEPGQQLSTAKECGLCNGTLTISIKLLLVEGHWWDKASEVVYVAGSFEKACEKLKIAEYPLLETNFDDRLQPYYVSHGGYAPGK